MSTGALEVTLLAGEREARFVRAMGDMIVGHVEHGEKTMAFFEGWPEVDGRSFQYELEGVSAIIEPEMVFWDEVEPLSQAAYRKLSSEVLDKLALRRTTDGGIPMDEQEVLARFDYVGELMEEELMAIETVRAGFKETARMILAVCPHGRSRNIALTKLEDASHYAIKAITHGR